MNPCCIHCATKVNLLNMLKGSKFGTKMFASVKQLLCFNNIQELRPECLEELLSRSALILHQFWVFFDEFVWWCTNVYNQWTAGSSVQPCHVMDTVCNEVLSHWNVKGLPWKKSHLDWSCIYFFQKCKLPLPETPNAPQYHQRGRVLNCMLSRRSLFSLGGYDVCVLKIKVSDLVLFDHRRAFPFCLGLF